MNEHTDVNCISAHADLRDGCQVWRVWPDQLVARAEQHVLRRYPLGQSTDRSKYSRLLIRFLGTTTRRQLGGEAPARPASALRPKSFGCSIAILLDSNLVVCNWKEKPNTFLYTLRHCPCWEAEPHTCRLESPLRVVSRVADLEEA